MTALAEFWRSIFSSCLSKLKTPLDYDHRELYDDFGFEWSNENSDYKERYRRFLKIFEVGQSLCYGFKQHALDKIEKFG